MTDTELRACNICGGKVLKTRKPSSKLDDIGFVKCCGCFKQTSFNNWPKNTDAKLKESS